MVPRQEHPNPIWMREEWFNLNGEWSFEPDEEDAGRAGAYESRPLDAFTRRITVPFSWTCPASGVELSDLHIGWYARDVVYTPSLDTDHIWLCFGAVDYECQVYINGREVGAHTGGYGPFSLDVTDDWRLDGPNRIAVRVEDQDRMSQTRGKQGYGETRGIWQTVHLETRPASFLRSMRFETRIDGSIRAVAQAHAAEAAVGVLSFEFGEVRAMQPVSLAAGENELACAFHIPDPKLWSPDAPYLYEGTVSLAVGLSTDYVSTYFGIREIGQAHFGDREYPWITLNGKPVYLNGTLDQSFNPHGYFTLPSEQAIIDEVQRLKDLGLNLDRIHIKPEEPRKLYWLDRMGVMVFEDMCCFWHDPDEETRTAWEAEMREVIPRDYGHPSIIAWIVFNETWGLFTEVAPGCRAYLPETRAWVGDMVDAARKLDPTRLVEDNSACNYDHIANTDLNTWHFYLNGYRIVRDHLRNIVDRTVAGGGFNFAPGEKAPDVPLMNSECGMVWGIENSAGDSDIAWQYHYMLNEFRLHEKICGFVFTEFHDVVNEFNGYYRINNDRKDFGYDGYVENMTVADLHAPDFIAIDAPPCQTVGGGEVVRVPLAYSGFGAGEGRTLTMRYELWYDALGARAVCDAGSLSVPSGWGLHALPDLVLRMPTSAALAVLAIQLYEGDRVVSRNFTTFDVRGKRPGSAENASAPDRQSLSFAPRDLVAKGFAVDWSALSGHKRNGAGAGSFSCDVDISALRGAARIEIAFEASAKRLLRKDQPGAAASDDAGNFMWGYHMDPGENENSYLMTDETAHPARIQVLIDGRAVADVTLPNDPADARGALSWHYQPADRYLDEAGSYGYLVRVDVPEDVAQAALEKGEMRFEIRALEGGVAVYGRNAGRYPIDICVMEG